MKSLLDQFQTCLIISREAIYHGGLFGSQRLSRNRVRFAKIFPTTCPDCRILVRKSRPNLCHKQAICRHLPSLCSHPTTFATHLDASSATLAWGVMLCSLPLAVQSKALDSDLPHSYETPTAIYVCGLESFQRTRSGSDYSTDSRA